MSDVRSVGPKSFPYVSIIFASVPSNCKHVNDEAALFPFHAAVANPNRITARKQGGIECVSNIPDCFGVRRDPGPFSRDPGQKLSSTPRGQLFFEQRLKQICLGHPDSSDSFHAAHMMVSFCQPKYIWAFCDLQNTRNFISNLSTVARRCAKWSPHEQDFRRDWSGEGRRDTRLRSKSFAEHGVPNNLSRKIMPRTANKNLASDLFHV